MAGCGAATPPSERGAPSAHCAPRPFADRAISCLHYVGRRMSERRSVHVPPSEVHERLAEHLLVDGYRLVLDTERSHGSWLVDARDGREYLDLYTMFASAPLGANHPAIVDDTAFMALLARVAAGKPANPDMYTTHLAEFVETFAR